MRSVAKLLSPVAQNNYGVGLKKHEVGCRTEEVGCRTEEVGINYNKTGCAKNFMWSVVNKQVL